MLKQLQQFINSPLNRTWIECDHIKFYVRKNHRVLNGEKRCCLDLPNIEVDESYRGTGIFTNLLSEIEKNLSIPFGFDAIYIENVINPRFSEFFRTRGYTAISQEISPSFFLLLNGD